MVKQVSDVHKIGLIDIWRIHICDSDLHAVSSTLFIASIHHFIHKLWMLQAHMLQYHVSF